MRYVLASAVLWLAVSSAHAQVAGFSPADYGKAALPQRQSTGDAADFISANKGAFEPVSELDPKDALFTLARSVGRVDIVMRDKRNGSEIGTSCTGSLLPGDYVLTNHHCLPISGDFEPLKASILMDYLTLDGKGSKRFDISVKPDEADAGLDYAIAKVSGEPTKEFGFVRIGGGDVLPGQSLLIVHHPMGRPKVISRFRCLAIKDQETGPELRHRCDTLGGSSGSLIYDNQTQGVAIHKEGGLDAKDATSFNSATRMIAILQKSRLMKAAAVSAPVPTTTGTGSAVRDAPVSGGLPTKTMNDILRQ